MRIRTFLVLSLLLGGLEATFVGKFDIQETLVGAVCALCAAALTVAVLDAARVAFAFRWSWIAIVRSIAWNIVRDTVIISRVLVARLRGATITDRIETIAFAPDGRGARVAAHRALLVAAVGASPNSVVLGVDAAASTLRVHKLVPEGRAAADAPRRWPL